MLLDENVLHHLRSFLRHHDTFTVVYAGFAGLKNGALLAAAEKAAFEVLVTGDKTLHREQNLTGRSIAIVLLSAVNWPVIEPHVARISTAVDKATPGSFTRVECGGFLRPGKLLNFSN